MGLVSLVSFRSFLRPVCFVDFLRLVRVLYFLRINEPPSRGKCFNTTLHVLFLSEPVSSWE